MAVSTTIVTARYLGNGVTTAFNFAGRVFTETDLKVSLVTRATDVVAEVLTLSTHYTVTITSNSLATVTITDAAKIPSTLQDILIELNLAATQAQELPTGTALPAKSIEVALDRVTMLIQLIQGKLDKCLKIAPEDTANIAYTSRLARASTLDGWDSNGNRFQYNLTPTGALDPSANYVFGSINNTPIGNTTRSSGAFTTLAANGAVTFTSTLAVTGAATFSSTVTGTALIPSGAAVPSNGMYLPATNALGWATNGLQRMQLGATGDFLFGQQTVAGLRYFDIQNTDGTSSSGSIIRLITQQVGSASTTTFDIIKRKDGTVALVNNETNSAAFISLNIGANERVRVDSSGNMFVGSTATIAGANSPVYASTTAKAWGNFNGTLTTPITPRSNFNAASITKGGTGDYTINFTNAMPNANYSIVGSCRKGATDTNLMFTIPNGGTYSTTACQVTTRTLNTFAVGDGDYVNFAVFAQ